MEETLGNASPPPMNTESDDHVFGTRYLTDESRVFEHNAWDDVVLSEETKSDLEETLRVSTPPKPVVLRCSEKKRLRELERDANGAGDWEQFHLRHSRDDGSILFFNNRAWLFREWPRLKLDAESLGVTGQHTILEIGCGAGATAIPLMQGNPSARIFAVDVSPTAIKALLCHPLSVSESDRLTAFVSDFSEITPASLDTIPTSVGDKREDEEKKGVFLRQTTTDLTVRRPISAVIERNSVFGALEPTVREQALLNLRQFACRNPACVFLFRDYARLDMANLRLHRNGRMYKDIPDVYRRFDGTLQSFFTEDGVRKLFESCGYQCRKVSTINRLMVNRKKKLKMYRRWIIGEFVLDDEWVGPTPSDSEQGDNGGSPSD